MNKEIIEKHREELAELEHEQWMSWTKYIAKEWMGKIPAKLKLRWVQNWKPYSELTEEEKDKDRKWADKIINLIKQDEHSKTN